MAKNIDVDRLVAAMTPEQLEKFRTAAVARGIPTGPEKSADGSLIFRISISADIAEQITQWSSALPDGMPLTEQVQHWVNEALTAYLYADWAARTTEPTAVVAAPAPVATAT